MIDHVIENPESQRDTPVDSGGGGGGYGIFQKNNISAFQSQSMFA